MLLGFVGEGILFNHGGVKLLFEKVDSTKGAGVFVLLVVFYLLGRLRDNCSASVLPLYVLLGISRVSMISAFGEILRPAGAKVSARPSLSSTRSGRNGSAMRRYESGVGQQSGASACQLTDLVYCHAQRDFPPGKPVVKTRSGHRTIAGPRPPSLLCSESRARLRRTRLPEHPPPPGCRLPAPAGHRALWEVSGSIRRCDQRRECRRVRDCLRLCGISAIGEFET